jgi:hypothetical protein
MLTANGSLRTRDEPPARSARDKPVEAIDILVLRSTCIGDDTHQQTPVTISHQPNAFE